MRGRAHCSGGATTRTGTERGSGPPPAPSTKTCSAAPCRLLNIGQQMVITELQKRLKALGDPRVAEASRRFFKTGPGEDGEGDRFRGIRAPVLWSLAKEFRATTLPEAGRLLGSTFHEDRLLALLILVRLYSRGDEALREEIYRLYLKSTRHINNWDLVDSS